MSISVIICTLNRAESLALTLKSLAAVAPVPGQSRELVVVDNGSTDATPQLLQSLAMPAGWEVRILNEPRKGLSRARNRGVAGAGGDVLLFSDDDVRFPESWMHTMSRPILDGEADALAGRVKLAPEACRPWMDSLHHIWLASTEPMDFAKTDWLVGANMSLSRKVFEKVPFFDEELGAGALGFAEETLFAWQLLAAGFRIRGASGQPVLHHPDPRRYSRRDLLASAKKRGQSTAYVLHHWRHGELPRPALRKNILRAKLFLRRLLQPPGGMDSEGAPSWELSYFSQLWLQQAYMEEVRNARKYEKSGLARKVPAKTTDDNKETVLLQKT